jgi:Tfp pilus assembly protein PilW
MSNTSVVVRMADGTRKAAVTLPKNLTIAQLLETTQQKWNLPATFNYAVRIERTGQQLTSNSSLVSAGIQEDDVLEIYPILEAGHNSQL